MYIYKVKNNIAAMLIILFILGLISILAYSSSNVEAADEAVDFKLKQNEEQVQVIEVTMSFRVERNKEMALLSPTQDSVSGYSEMLQNVNEPQYRIVSISNELIKIDDLPGGSGGWLVTGINNGVAEIKYEIEFPDPVINASEGTSNGSGGDTPIFPIIKADLNVFPAFQLLLCPREYPKMNYYCDKSVIHVDLDENQTLFVPWDLKDGKSEFEVKEIGELNDNFICWGKIDEVTVRKDNPQIIAGFSTDYQSLADTEKDTYAENIGTLYTEQANVLGERPGLDRLTLMLCGARRFSLSSPQWCTLNSSAVIFHGGKKLDGEPAVCAAGSLFDLWNHFSFTPDANGDAMWFMEGMSRLYPICAANDAALLSENDADELLSGIYYDYISVPGNYELSIQAASAKAAGAGFTGAVSDSGAVLCGAVGKRLTEKSSGEKDLSWFVGEVSKEYRGEKYSLDGIVDILEKGAGGGWKRFVDDRVLEKHLFLASEIMNSNIFKAGSAHTSGSGSSTRNWILLGIAVVVILSLPFLFSTYVGRAVKLDVRMPKILPDDWDEDESESGTDGDPKDQGEN